MSDVNRLNYNNPHNFCSKCGGARGCPELCRYDASGNWIEETEMGRVMSDIVERLDRADDVPIFEEAAAEIRRLRAENERLREALKPFATMADQVDEWEKGTGNFTGNFDAADLRRARAALAQHDGRPSKASDG
jgi:hypothetical protein